MSSADFQGVALVVVAFVMFNLGILCVNFIVRQAADPMQQAATTSSGEPLIHAFLASLVEGWRSFSEMVERPSPARRKRAARVWAMTRFWNEVIYGPQDKIQEWMNEIQENMDYVIENLPDRSIRMPEIPVVRTTHWLHSDSLFSLEDVDRMAEEERTSFFRKKWAEFADLVEWCGQQERPVYTLGLILQVFKTEHYVPYLDHLWWKRGGIRGDSYPDLFWKAMNKNMFNSQQDKKMFENEDKQREQDTAREKHGRAAGELEEEA